jgi:hypothetical protein
MGRRRHTAVITITIRAAAIITTITIPSSSSITVSVMCCNNY